MTVAVTKNQGMVTTTSQVKGLFDDQQIAILKSSYAKNLDNVEFKVFLETAAALKLNPFSREIYAIKYGGTMSLVTSIDGYRKLSARSGRFMGVTNGRLRVKTRDAQALTIMHEDYDPDEHTIISGTIGIRVRDWPDPIESTAVMRTYRKDTANWKSMPDVMILKCAEASAHRKAALLPDLGALVNVAPLYIEDEIQDYGIVDIAPEPPKATLAEIKEHKPSKRFPMPKESIIETLEVPVPAPAKETTAIEPEVLPDTPPTVGPAEDLLNKAWDYYRKQGCSEEGIGYAKSLVAGEFQVEDITMIADIKSLRDYCLNRLSKELQAENFIAMALNRE